MMWELTLALTLAAASPGPAEEVFLLREPDEPALSVHHQPGPGPSVLYVHGATFPAALSINYRIEGKSWADDLQARGLDVWSFDLAGYGQSDRPPAMHLGSVARARVPGRTADVAHQIGRVVHHILTKTRHSRVSIIAHSWATIPAGLFTGTHPLLVDRLVLFGPIARRDGTEREGGPTAPSILISASRQWQSFQAREPNDVPPPISKERFDIWAETYLASDTTSKERSPPSVRIPAGPDVDFEDAWNGRFPYDPAIIDRPTLIVRGEWDPVSRDSDAAWLVGAMKNVPGGARDVKLAHGAHRMHLEENRQALFDAVGDFLTEDQR